MKAIQIVEDESKDGEGGAARPPMGRHDRAADQIDRYAEAVDADRYRVTAIRMQEDGSKKAMILDKKDGESKGFTREELKGKLPEMQRLKERGENLYITPLSKDKHHILIDDLSREKLGKMIGDGHKPAAIIESSPGNYQALLTIKKQGGAHDKDVANRLSEKLNRAYGDPKLSGAIHPHRAPGFENQKAKHKREDGSYPKSRLLKAEKRECPKTAEMASEITKSYETAAKSRDKSPQPGSPKAPGMEQSPGGADPATARAYRGHRAGVERLMTATKGMPPGEQDRSRVDSMVALRLRMTGHSRDAIESAVRECGPESRGGGKEGKEGRESHQWDDYAKRTADWAYSPAGDQQAAGLEKYREGWKAAEQQIERRERAKAESKAQADAPREKRQAPERVQKALKDRGHDESAQEREQGREMGQEQGMGMGMG